VTVNSFLVQDGTAGRWKITVYCELVSTNSTNNKSTWRYRGYLQDGPYGVGQTGTIRNTWYVNVYSSGTYITGKTGAAFAYSPDNGTVYLFNEQTFEVDQSSTGTLDLTVACFAEGDIGPSTTVYSASGTMTVIGEPDIARPPLPPAVPVITRTGIGTSITISSAVASPALGINAPPAITDYKYRWSTTGTGSWTEVTGMGTSRTQDFGPTSPVTVSGTQVYYFQTAAINSEGSSPWSANGIAYAAPSITSITKNGTSATVTVTPASSDGGSTVTFYTVEYSIDQSTWVGGQSIFGASGGSTTFTSLPAGKTYYFRAYATNAIPVNSPYQYNLSTGSTASIYISAYGKRYATSGAITNITTSGGDITYTSSNSFSANDTVTITGVTPSQYNLTNATIKSATSTQFVITNSATGTIQNPKTGTASGWATITTAKRLESVVSYTSFGTVTKLYADSSETNIARYDSATANTVNKGDSVTVTGISSPYAAANTSNATLNNEQNKGETW